jgi:L-lactate dehydrogenase complex protein LldF
MNNNAQKYQEDAARICAESTHRQIIGTALDKYAQGRDKKIAEFQNWEQARESAAQIKQEGLDDMEALLRTLTKKLTKRGTHVYRAPTGADACRIVLNILKQNGAKTMVKSKSMTSEEIHLNEALEKEGYRPIESDLGEFIVQLRQEPPYHIVFPAMHLTRYQISDLFRDKLGCEPTENPEELTMIARKNLRREYVQADVGFTGANFAVAETGMISVTENEGNSRLSASLPKIMITLIGIEKVVPRMQDLSLLLPMLATVGAAQSISCYNTLYSGPRQPDECDGPEEYHVILLDNGRSRLAKDSTFREILRCIRCGSCINVCPIYRNVGGHAYNATYPGPIGSVLMPQLFDMQTYKHLSFACSLCGACRDMCPVKINLPHLLLKNREAASTTQPKVFEKLAFKAMSLLFNKPLFWKWGKRMGWIGQKFHPLIEGSVIDPAQCWTATRKAPKLKWKSFKDLWKKHSK